MTAVNTPALEVTDDGAERHVALRGAITEATDFARALEPGPRLVTIDLSSVDRVNSFGVREWIRFLKTLVDAGARVVLDRVSVPMVRQMNMIPQVRGGAEVRSVFAPYYCPACDDEQRIPLAAGSRSAPEHAPCPACSAEMEFDDVPDAYFAFAADEPAR